MGDELNPSEPILATSIHVTVFFLLLSVSHRPLVNFNMCAVVPQLSGCLANATMHWFVVLCTVGYKDGKKMHKKVIRT